MPAPRRARHHSRACRRTDRRLPASADATTSRRSAEAAAAAGNVAIPLVKALTAEVAKADAEGRRLRALGRDQPGLIDTALMLELRAVIDALSPISTVRSMASRAGRSPPPQPAAGAHLAAARFADAVRAEARGLCRCTARSRDGCGGCASEALVLQFGGAAGTLAALGDRGLDSPKARRALDLPLPDAPWHSHRDRLAEVASALSILAGTCGKIARDVSLLMQTEVGEAFEPAAPGRGGSSTMPHKRNPVAASAALAGGDDRAAISRPPSSPRRSRSTSARLGGWRRNGTTFPALALVTSGALRAIADIAEGLEIDVDGCAPTSPPAAGISWPRRCRLRSPRRSASPTRTHRRGGDRKYAASPADLPWCWARATGITSYSTATELTRLFMPTSLSGRRPDPHRPACRLGAGRAPT